MTEKTTKTDLLYAQYRGKSAPIPRPNTLSELSQIIEQRVKPGLAKLLGRTSIEPVEYGGYALTGYRTPLEMMELFEIFGSQEIIDALKNAGMNVNTQKNRDDFWVERFEHFDQMQDPSRGSVWTQDYNEATGLGGLRTENFLLGPVARGPVQFACDRFNQNADTDFAHDYAVHVSSALLLQGLYEYRPQLREGWAISSGIMANFLTDRFDLQPEI